MDYRGDPVTGRMKDDPRNNTFPPPPPSSRGPPMEPQGSANINWYLFYSPRSPPSMKFIAEAKKIDQICSNINLINFDEDPKQMVIDNPWLRKHGLPALVMDGQVFSGRDLFNWLSEFNQSSQGQQQQQQQQQQQNNEPSASHLGEPSFNIYSDLGNVSSSDIATENYSSIGARQGSEGMNHENFSDSGNPTLSLDALEAQRVNQLK